MKKKYRDGTEILLFLPMELMEKLAALVPKPRAHITRYHGLFAPHLAKFQVPITATSNGRIEGIRPRAV